MDIHNDTILLTQNTTAQFLYFKQILLMEHCKVIWIFILRSFYTKNEFSIGIHITIALSFVMKACICEYFWSILKAKCSWQSNIMAGHNAFSWGSSGKKKPPQITVVSTLQYLPVTFLVLMQLSSAALWDTCQHLLWHSIRILLALQMRNWSLWRINLEPNYCPPGMHKWTSTVWETDMPGQHCWETMHFQWLCDCSESFSHPPEKYVAIKHINADRWK